MAKQTTVLIYKVADAGVTGAKEGEDALNNPCLVLVLSPQFHRVAYNHGFRRLRTEIRPEAEGRGPVEALDESERLGVTGVAKSE